MVAAKLIDWATLEQVKQPQAASYRSASEFSVRLFKFTLIIGYGLFGLGVFAAHRSPATGYEISIYWATQSLYWFGVGGALTLALASLLYDYRSRFAPASMVLAGASVTSFLALPVIRGYYFHGYQDPMAHLGSIRALLAGQLEFIAPMYPGSYGVTAFLSSLSGLPVNRSMLYVTLSFAVVFLLFVPMAVSVIVPDRRAVILGLFSAFLLLPINNVSLYYRFHPFSLNTLFFPLVGYLFLAHITGTLDDNRLPGSLAASTLALPVATGALLLFHPQTTADVLILFAVVAAVQLFYRRYDPSHPLAQYRAVYWQFLLLAGMFVLWTSIHPGTDRAIQTLVEGVISWFTGSGQAGQVVESRTSSADTIDVSIYELFVKIFLVSAVYCLLTVSLVVAKFRGWVGDGANSAGPIESDTLMYFTFGGLGLLPFVAVHSFGRADAYLFRHLGFAMSIVTILGAVALYYAILYTVPRLGSLRQAAKPLFGVMVTVAVVLSLLTVYSSPFIYLPGQHVSSQEMSGMQSSFELQPEDRSVWFGGIRQSSNRYESAMFYKPNTGWEGSPRARSSGPVTEGNITRLRSHYENHWESITQRDHYFMHSRQDYQSEVVAYNGVRYSAENISAVRDQEGVYNVYSNGEFRLYYVDTTGEPIANETVRREAEEENG